MKQVLWKIRYYFKRLFNMDFSGFFDAINYAHSKSGKNRVVLFFDMVWCSFKYTAGYVDYNEFEFYDLNAAQRATFITLGHSARIAKIYNDPEYLDIFDDKAIFVKRFSDYVHRDTLDLRDHTPEDLNHFMMKHGKVMAKRTTDYVGRGIEALDMNDFTSDEFEGLYTRLIENGQYLVEEFFKQHETMNQLSPKSVNTLRVITFLDDDHIPRILVSVLKSGLGSHVDNIGQGGMYTILNDHGTVVYPFIDKHGNQHVNHPITHTSLIGFQVPHYEALIESVRNACLEVPSVRYMGWDVAVGVNGPEIIEGNSSTGPFQVIPSMSDSKVGVKPIYDRYIKKY